MLSIRFDSRNEWWVSGGAFTRLFQAAQKDGLMAKDLEQWLHVADANGGLDVSQIAPAEAVRLATALRSTAEREVQRLRDLTPTSDDGSYRASLQKLLALDNIAALR